MVPRRPFRETQEMILFWEFVLHLAVLGWLVSCAILDLRTRRVPNALSIPPLILAIVIRVSSGRGQHRKPPRRGAYFHDPLAARQNGRGGCQGDGGACRVLAGGVPDLARRIRILGHCPITPQGAPRVGCWDPAGRRGSHDRFWV